MSERTGERRSPASGADEGGRVSHLRIVRGDATPEEIAALVVALASRATPQAEAVRKQANWHNPSHRMRKSLPTGQGAWRSSGLPR
ncbi:acyl-CoA carboxylase subunit epsilon [Planomonospora sp. ID67723]|uniref:acyl-CoA carboxylase subunit epsilon n=1 Tax=Planomonospora sp. ID67723 TaxID=2738134 RepID=UPI0018C3FE27|nr:acyl-CoA carboxylase subunit epsilon [Planomonospora sp. ID67723]MBG0827983.1 acyl-CoA carboxylase subunit epsilon [Planomonospora sp. ID67723]